MPKKKESTKAPKEASVEEPSTMRVRVGANFHQYRRGDDLIVEITPFTQALIDNGIFTEVA